MQKPDTDLAEEVAFEAEWAEAAVHPGPHSLIRQPDMRLFWWRTFGSQEEVTWDIFWSRFPKDLNRQGHHCISPAVPHTGCHKKQCACKVSTGPAGCHSMDWRISALQRTIASMRHMRIQCMTKTSALGIG